MSDKKDGTKNLVDIAPAQSVDHQTPPKILVPVRSYFRGRIPLDPATVKDNPTRAKKFFTKDDGEWGGLEADWDAPFFLNPPFSTMGAEDLERAKACGKKLFGLDKVTSWMQVWSAKINREVSRGRTGIVLLPCGARYGTGYWQDHIFCEFLSATCWVRGRVSFIDPVTKEPKKGNPHDSQILLYNGSAHRFAVDFGELGRVFKMEALA